MPVDLSNYLRQRKSPLADHVNELYAAANRHRIDPRLLVAISGGETSFGTQGHGPKVFNAWGIGPGYRYSSWAEGLNAAAKLLRSGYVGQGLTSLAKIQSKWAPLAATNDPTGLNNNWLRNMSRIYQDLGGNPNNVVAGWRKASAPGSKQRTAPQPVPSVQPQTGQPLSLKMPDLSGFAPPSPRDIAASNLAEIAAGKSPVETLGRLSAAKTEYSQFTAMLDATMTAAAAQRLDAPNGQTAPVKTKEGGTYTTTPTSETSKNDKVMQAIQIAKKQIGKPYIWGAESPKEGGFDCSGLIDYAFRQAGIPMPAGRRTTWNMVGMGKSIRQGAMKPGDWLITNKGKHVVMYIGGGQVVAASSSAGKTTLQPVSAFKGDIVDIRRYP